MMEIEKKFAVTDLSQFKTTAYEKFITDCYKYSRFKQGEAIKRINRYGKTEKTVRTYLSAVRCYLQNGQRHQHVSNKLYNIIDNLLSKSVQRLTPPKGLESTQVEKTKKKKVSLGKKNVSTVKQSEEKNVSFLKSLFVVLQNGRIKKDYKTDVECIAYTDALKDMGVGANIEVKKIYFE